MKTKLCLLFIGAAITVALKSQDSNACVIDFDALTFPVLMEGEVEVFKFDGGKFRKSDRVHSRQYVLVDRVADTMFYTEIKSWKEGEADLSVREFKFRLEENQLSFYNSRDFWRFPKLARLIFLFDRLGNISFPMRQLDPAFTEEGKEYKDDSFDTFIRTRSIVDYWDVIQLEAVGEINGSKDSIVFDITKVLLVRELNSMPRELYSPRQWRKRLKKYLRSPPRKWWWMRSYSGHLTIDKETKFYDEIKFVDYDFNTSQFLEEKSILKIFTYNRLLSIPDQVLKLIGR